MCCYCVECVNSKKTRSKTCVGYCKKHNVQHLGIPDGCSDGVRKRVEGDGYVVITKLDTLKKENPVLAGCDVEQVAKFLSGLSPTGQNCDVCGFVFGTDDCSKRGCIAGITEYLNSETREFHIGVLLDEPKRNTEKDKTGQNID